jgi:hypothetical protein
MSSGTTIEQDEDGWWAYYGPGTRSVLSSDRDPLHSDHEDTKRELMKLVKAAEPCKCKDCVKDLSGTKKLVKQ